ncbi:TIGR02285 family protein [Maridesulfovibrio sp.]|uniref:TIGR02285 family protein n=1 Tax=unclassified Maridesulfovibrio TaxID=2794999 RepID=UPI003B007483
MKRIIYTVLILILSTYQTALCDEDTIVWYHADYPPGSICKGPLKGKGYHDQFMKSLRDKLPEYTHTYRVANYSRIAKQLSISNGCCITIYKTKERLKYIEYTQPTILGLTNGVHILTKNLYKFKPFINPAGQISIIDLLENTNLRMGISKGRRYTGVLDDWIEKNAGSNNLYTYYKKDIFEGLIKLLEAERNVDFVIGHPQEISWLLKQGIVEDKFLFIPIKELNPYSIAYIGCTKNKWGKKVVSKINKLLNHTYDPDYIQAHQSYLPPEGIKLHNAYLKKVFPANCGPAEK